MGSVSSRADVEGAGAGVGAGDGAWTKAPSDTSRPAHKPFTADIASTLTAVRLLDADVDQLDRQHARHGQRVRAGPAEVVALPAARQAPRVEGVHVDRVRPGGEAVE